MNSHGSRFRLDRRILTGVMTTVLLLAPALLARTGGAGVRILDYALLYVLLALGLNVVVGFAGLLDLGFIAFYAVGAYLYALLASPHLWEQFDAVRHLFPGGMHVPLWVCMPLAGLVAAFFGVVLGIPTLKLRGDYLAIVTLGFGEIMRIFMNNLNAPVNITNGPQGISQIDAPSLLGVSFAGRKGVVDVFGLQLPPVLLYYYVLLLIVIVATVFCFRLTDSRIGRAWRAIREDEVAAKAMGINTRNAKLLAFGMGAVFGGVSGSLFAALQGFVSPESFTLFESIVVLAMVVLGGLGNIPGVIVGAVLLSAIPEALRFIVVPAQETFLGKGNALVDAEIARQLLYGLAMIGVMLWRPSGLLTKRAHLRAESGETEQQVEPELVSPRASLVA
jgi:branched-chain amino acid transport system permease protein